MLLASKTLNTAKTTTAVPLQDVGWRGLAAKKGDLTNVAQVWLRSFRHRSRSTIDRGVVGDTLRPPNKHPCR